MMMHRLHQPLLLWLVFLLQPCLCFVERFSAEHLSDEHWDPSVFLSAVFPDPPHLLGQQWTVGGDEALRRRDRVRDLLRVSTESNLHDLILYLCDGGWRPLVFSGLACSNPQAYIEAVHLRGVKIDVAVKHFPLEREFSVVNDDGPMHTLFRQCMALDLEMEWCFTVVRDLTLQRLCNLKDLAHRNSDASRAVADACSLHKSREIFDLQLLSPLDRGRYYGQELSILAEMLPVSMLSLMPPGSCEVCVKIEGRDSGCIKVEDNTKTFAGKMTVPVVELGSMRCLPDGDVCVDRTQLPGLRRVEVRLQCGGSAPGLQAGSTNISEKATPWVMARRFSTTYVTPTTEGRPLRGRERSSRPPPTQAVFYRVNHDAGTAEGSNPYRLVSPDLLARVTSDRLVIQAPGELEGPALSITDQAQRFCTTSSLLLNNNNHNNHNNNNNNNRSSSPLTPSRCESFISTLIREQLQERVFLYMWRLHRDSQADGFLHFDEIEGGVFCFPRKIKYLQGVALDHSTVSPSSTTGTVCEVGFNAGHSSLIWLLSTPPTTRVLSFDLLDHGYTASAADLLHHLFPGRLEVVVGGSSMSVPTFAELHPDFKCDIIFIDGGHEEQQALDDLRSFRALATADTRVLLDDMDVATVRRALGRAVEDGMVKTGDRSWHRVETTGIQNSLLEEGEEARNGSVWSLWRTRPTLHLYSGMYAEIATLSYLQ